MRHAAKLKLLDETDPLKMFFHGAAGDKPSDERTDESTDINSDDWPVRRAELFQKVDEGLVRHLTRFTKMLALQEVSK